MQMKPTRIAPLIAAVLLAACGGGGGGDDGDDATSPVDSHVGTWSLCGTDFEVPSIEVRYVISKVDDDTASYQAEGLAYSTDDCSGTAVATATESGVWQFEGTRRIGGRTVNLIEETVVSDSSDSTTEPRTRKDFTLVSDNQLFSGTEPPGADGYPTALDTENSLDRE